jgi:hypothetical protein
MLHAVYNHTIPTPSLACIPLKATVIDDLLSALLLHAAPLLGLCKFATSLLSSPNFERATHVALAIG